MGREIKVRGWDGKQMLEPQDLTQNRKYWTWLGKQDVELMEWTGLLDKNDKEIWEGDLLKVIFVDAIGMEHIITGIVEMHSPKKWGATGWYVRTKDTQPYFDFNDYDDTLEIIGNSFENPELLDK